MDINEAVHAPAAAQPRMNGRAASRRRMLAAGVSGVLVSVLRELNSGAAASGGGSTPPETDAPTDPTDDTTAEPFGPDTTNASDITTGGTDSDTDPTDPSADTNDTQAPTGDSTSGSGPTEDTEPATTTTAPPSRPTEADLVLLNFAQGVELTIRDLYDVAITGQVFEGPAAIDIAAIREAHEGYATAIAGLIGRDAANTAVVPLFGQLQGNFRGSTETVASNAASLENTAVATHLDLIGQLIGVDGSALIASMAVVEARHATLLNVMAGATELADQLADSGAALSPSSYSK